MSFFHRKERSRSSPYKLIVGLGNPGAAYAKTRHNAGWWALDELFKQLQNTKQKSAPNGNMVKCDMPRVLLLKPETFMNRSGECVAAVMRKNGIGPENLLVIYDDIDLPCGRLRIRPAGGPGTHNGMASVVARVGSTEFPRIRMGVGGPPPGMDLADYVLKAPPPHDREALQKATEAAAGAALAWAAGETIENVMNRYNNQG
ncbi:MAG: aminoacyl-tRNA hydrolase [Clostridia bacterium]|nr:aminoacyl-tRNA hydrolase [Clostridia bacterium]